MRPALLAALMMQAQFAAGIEVGVLPIRFEDDHRGSFGWFARVAYLDQPHALILVDAHSDATAVDHSDAIRNDLRRVVSDEQRSERIKDWLAKGRVQSFDWIEPLMPQPIDRVFWIAGWKLSPEEKEQRSHDAKESIDARLEFEARAAGEFGSRWTIGDAGDLDAWEPPAMPILASIDLDAFSGLSAGDAEAHFHQIWTKLLDLPRLRAVSFAISRPWLKDDAEAYRLVRMALDEIRLVRGARVELNPFPAEAPDDSLLARELASRGAAPPRFRFENAPLNLRALLVLHRDRWTPETDCERWNQLLDQWAANDPTSWEIRADDLQESTDGCWRAAVGNLPTLRVWNAQERETPRRVRWRMLAPGRECYNLLPDSPLGQGFAENAPPAIREEPRFLTETNDGALAAETWRKALDPATGWGRVRIEAEIEFGGAWLPTPPIEVRVAAGTGFHAGLSERFGTPYAFGIAFARDGFIDGADTGWGNDCANFLIAAWRRTGRAIPWGNPAQLRTRLRTLAPEATVESRVPISSRDIERGLVIDFGQHVAAVWEDREPKGILGPEDIVVHHLGGMPERITLGEMTKTRPHFAVRALPADPETRVTIGGDVVLSQVTHDSVERIAPDLKGAALALVNLEGVPAEPESPPPQRYNFAFPPERLAWLAESGVRAIGMANNHAGDAGLGGLSKALQAFVSSKLALVGAGADETSAIAPWFTNVCGVPLAVFAVSCVESVAAGPSKPGVSCLPQHAAQIEAALAKAKGEGRTIIVLAHWGREYTLEIDDEQRHWARWLIDHGADAVVGAHPHVVQALDYWRGRPIAYSLGNAVYPESLSRLASGAWLDLFINKNGAIEAPSLRPILDRSSRQAQREVK